MIRILLFTCTMIASLLAVGCGAPPKAVGHAWVVKNVPVYQRVQMNPIVEVSPNHFVAHTPDGWIWIYQEPLWRDSSLSYGRTFPTKELAAADLKAYKRDTEVRDRSKWLVDAQKAVSRRTH